MHAGKSGYYVGSPEFPIINLGMSHMEKNPNVSRSQLADYLCPLLMASDCK